jgi:hypothetical protein
MLSRMTLSIMAFNAFAECCYAKCRMLSVIMLSVVMLSVIMLNVVMLNAVAPHVLEAQAYFYIASATQKKVYFVKHLAAGGSNCQKRCLKN